MCGRLTLTANIKEIREHFFINYGSGAVIVPRYNIAPSQLLLIIKDNKLDFLKWGIKLPNNGSIIINAKIETVLEKKLFSMAFKKQRCLIVGSGFFEWKTVSGRKIPYYIQIKNQNILGFAGIIVNDSCVIFTTESDPTKYQVNFHNRMPVIIKQEYYSLWLDPRTPVLDLMNPKIQFEQTEFLMHPVSSQVNNAKLDNIACIKSLIS